MNEIGIVPVTVANKPARHTFRAVTVQKSPRTNRSRSVPRDVVARPEILFWSLRKLVGGQSVASAMNSQVTNCKIACNFLSRHTSCVNGALLGLIEPNHAVVVWQCFHQTKFCWDLRSARRRWNCSPTGGGLVGRCIFRTAPTGTEQAQYQ